jgi:hypothetical protein
MTEHFERVIKGSVNFDLWLAISEFQIADALAILSPALPSKSQPWWKIWASPTEPVYLDPVRKTALALLTNTADAAWLTPEMTLKTADTVLPEWMRFCCSVHYSGHFSEQLEILLKETAGKLGHLAEEVHA